MAKEYGRWFTERSFDVAATVTLCQAKRYESDRGMGWRSGDAILYDGVYTGLINRLNKAVFGRRAYENGSRLPNAGCVEGDGKIIAHHLHVAIKRPDWMPFDKIKLLIEETWTQSPWVKADLDVQEIHGAWVYYISKEGPDALLFA